MQAIEALRAFFAQEPDVAAVYLYGRYAGDRSYPDTDIEIALLFPEETDEEAIRDYMDRLAGAAPLGGEPGILLPFALNTHIPPVIYEILHGGTLLVENHPEARAAAVRALEARVEGERASLLEDAKEAILQARSLGLAVAALDGFVLPQPPRYLDPIRVGWRLARVLGSAAVLDQGGVPVHVASASLGDRVRITSITVQGGTITVDLVTHGPQDPLCCPTLQKVVRYRLVGGQLVEG